jgi:hypothetical protein
VLLLKLSSRKQLKSKPIKKAASKAALRDIKK